MGVQTNQVRHMLVAKELVSVTPTKEGQIRLRTNPSGSKVWFEFMGKGGLITSDYIDKECVTRVVGVKALDQAIALKKAIITLNPDIVNADGDVIPVAGQHYIVNLIARQFVDLSEEGQYGKFGEVTITNNMTASKVYSKLAISLAKNFSKEQFKFYKFYLVDEDDERTEVTPLTKEATLTGTYTAVEVEEVEQPWELGYPKKTVNFSVESRDIEYEGDTVKPIHVEMEDTDTIIGNGAEMANTEYFCHGEIGDHLRMAGYPNVIKTKLFIGEAGAEQMYHAIEIHHYQVNGGVSVQRSEKDLLIAIPAGKEGDEYTVAKAIAAAIDAQFGTEAADAFDE